MYSTERAVPFYRELGNVSARAGYGGGIGSGPNGQICGANGPDGTLYSTFGYAQAVQVRAPLRSALNPRLCFAPTLLMHRCVAFAVGINPGRP